MSALLEQEIADYTRRRDALVSGIMAFADWLDRYQGMDAERNLRFIELANALRKDRLMLAFVAEYSRGKTELINALFFADFGQRLLPSDAGRTTMCPTEVFYEEGQEPSLRLLPIESRLKTEPLGHLKLNHVEWSTIRLDPEDPRQMQAALQKLTEVRKVTQAEADALGLLNASNGVLAPQVDADGLVEIPAWRYAMINFPHPMLKAGLSILDTPGLNALGAEPELTLSSIPGAHAVFFLLATDAGVTKSDLEIWQHYVHKHVNYHVAVLNKIDMLWDDLRGELVYRSTLQKQLDETARVLKLPANQVFAVSAQKALVGKVRDDAELISRSGIVGLENLLANKIVPSRREILYRGATAQVGAQISYERATLSVKLREGLQNIKHLTALSGKNRELATQLHNNLLRDKSRYDATASQFKTTRKVVRQHGDQLLAQLSEDSLHIMMDNARMDMGDTWTTKGLIRTMRTLSEQAIERFSQAEKFSVAVQQYLANACESFHRQHGLPRMALPALDLTAYRLRMDKLMRETEEFCTNPGNLLVEKRFMIRRFFNEVAAESQKTFGLAGKEARRWLSVALDPVMRRVKEYKQVLEDRLETVRRISDNVSGVQEQMARVKAEIDQLRKQTAELDAIAKNFSPGGP
jgi:hypothetical protein